jgi:hypothetical protein
MGLGTVQILKARRNAIVALAAFMAAISLMIVSASRAQQPDSRPRQTGTATPSPTATPAQTGPGRRPQLGAPPPAADFETKADAHARSDQRGDRREFTHNHQHGTGDAARPRNRSQ